MQRETRCSRPQPGAEAGFTLVELMIVVAIVGMLSSIAVPGLQRALHKSKRNAAVSDMRVLRDALMRYAGDTGSFPGWSRIQGRNLDVLAPTYLKGTDRVLANLRGKEIELYIPFDLFKDFGTAGNPDTLIELLQADAPQSFTIIAHASHDRHMKYYVTDSRTLYWTPEEGYVEVGED